MADMVNSQVTDAVTQTNVKIIAESPAMAMGLVYQMLGQAVGLTMQSSAAAQQQMQTVGLVFCQISYNTVNSARK